MNQLVEDLPGYRANIREKIADVRGVGKGSAVEKLQDTLEEIKIELGDEGAERARVTRRRGHARDPAGSPGSDGSARWWRRLAKPD